MCECDFCITLLLVIDFLSFMHLVNTKLIILIMWYGEGVHGMEKCS